MNKQLLTWRLWCLEVNFNQFMFGFDFVSHEGSNNEGRDQNHIGSFGVNFGPFILVRYFLK